MKGVCWAAAIVVFAAGCTIAVHELAHLLAGRNLGIPLARFVFFDRGTLSPAITWDVAQGSWQLTVTHYAGGLAGSTFACLLYFALRRRHDANLVWWGAPAIVAGIVSWQFCLAVLEGGFHDAYIGGAVGKGAGTTQGQTFAFLLGVGLHFWRTRGWKVLLRASTDSKAH